MSLLKIALLLELRRVVRRLRAKAELWALMVTSCLPR